MGFFNLCQFGLIVILAKFAGNEVLGQYTYALAIATPVVLFCSLELRGALVADTRQDFTFGTYRALRTTMMLVAAVVLLGVVAWSASREARYGFTLVLAGVSAVKVALFLAEVNWGAFQKRERMDLQALAVALRGIVAIALCALIVPAAYYASPTDDPSANRMATAAGSATLTAAVISVIILLTFDRPRAARGADVDTSWNWADVRRLAVQTFPLGLVLLNIHLCDSVPKWVIERQPDGKATLGYFGAMAYVTLVGNLLIIQAANASANRLSSYYQSSLPRFLRLAGLLVILAALIAAGILTVAFVFGEWILRVLYRPEYAQFTTEFRIIVAAQCLALLSNIFGVATTQMRLFWLQVPGQVVVLIATTVAALTLIPGDPLRGAAWTLMVRAGVQATLYTGFVVVGIVLRNRLLSRREHAARSAAFRQAPEDEV